MDFPDTTRLVCLCTTAVNNDVQLLLNSTHSVGQVPELWGRMLQGQHAGYAALTCRVCTELGECGVNEIRFSSLHHQT